VASSDKLTRQQLYAPAVVGGLTEEHQARIKAALPPGKVMTPEAWINLNEIIIGYRIFETRRTTYPIVEKRKRWQRLGKAVEAAAAELRRLRRETPWSGPDPGWINRALAALWEVNRKVETRAAFHNIWRAFGRRQNPHREFLYWGVMRVWTDQLGGELRYSKSPEKRLPSGPLIRFLVACVEPILGDETPGAGLGDIIDREREARAATEDYKRQWREMGF
jgi:hypothetical protein